MKLAKVRAAAIALRVLASAVVLFAIAAPANARDFDIPTGAARSPIYNARPFTQRVLLFEEFGLQPMPSGPCLNCAPLPPPASCVGAPSGAALDNFLRQQLWPAPTRQANSTLPNYWAANVGVCVRPLSTSSVEGRPPGEWYAHQRWEEFFPEVYFQTAQTGARVNNGLRDAAQRHRYAVGEFAAGGLYNYGGTTRGLQVRFHPNFPVQQANSVWTFDGTMPPKLLMARMGEPVLLRHFNALPISAAANNGFGAHTITTHAHNGHNPAESDGYTAAFFFPGQFYDYHWPMQLAGHDSINTNASDPRAAMPNGDNDIRIRGDWRETMSTHWFHDHMLDYTAQNVYKGNAAMMNIYSAVDRGREGYRCHYQNPSNPNLCLPSGTALDWGNRDYDINLLIADKAWDRNGQLWYNIFQRDGFLGDRMLVNWTWMPYMDVRPRRYRLRLLNGAVARYMQIAIVTQTGQRVPFHMVANDGNIMEHAIAFPNAESQDLPVQGIAERYDIVIDFSQFARGTRIYLVNLLEHRDGRGPERIVPLANVLSGRYSGDPAVGRFMEFRVGAPSGQPDLSMNPADYVPGRNTMIPRPEVPANVTSIAERRSFDFGRSGGTDEAPWTIKVDGGDGLQADPNRVSLTVNNDGWQIWELNSGDGWDHPVHVHFEEARILSRDGHEPPIWERYARKDVFRVGGGPMSTTNVEILVRFREFLGTYVEHCHNTTHEDHSMLLRWDRQNPGQVLAIPTPVIDWEGIYYEPSVILADGRDEEDDD